MRIKIVFILLFYLLDIFAFGKDTNLSRYKELYKDLSNCHTIGYKGKLYSEMQGSLFYTNLYTDFAIYGNGFFKVYDNINNKYYYTRNGDFQLKLCPHITSLCLDIKR